MRKMKRIGIAFLALILLSGCSEKSSDMDYTQPSEAVPSANTETMEEISQPSEVSEESVEQAFTEPQIKEMDWSQYFKDLDGTGVIYDPADNCYLIYNPELASIQRSPCSTFKIISSLAALEKGVIIPENSVREWSGEVFWNEAWNQDINFEEAFRTSCVWYFREIIDEIGADSMQTELEKLQYGNCDISDWEGRLNTNNSNRALTGFWIESSLKISPKEQTEVMERIFGSQSEYAEETKNKLEEVMLVPEQERTDISVYGKTGMGKAEGVTVDAWFTGFADVTDKRIYFCVYLGETEGADVSSTKAKEIALKIVSDTYGAEEQSGS